MQRCNMLISADTCHIDLLTKTQFTIAKEVFGLSRYQLRPI